MRRTTICISFEPAYSFCFDDHRIPERLWGRHLIRAAMVFTFLPFMIQKWSQIYRCDASPLNLHSPVVPSCWLQPSAFGRRLLPRDGPKRILSLSLIFLGYLSPRKTWHPGRRLWVDRTFIGHQLSIIPFLPDGWAP